MTTDPSQLFWYYLFFFGLLSLIAYWVAMYVYRPKLVFRIFPDDVACKEYVSDPTRYAILGAHPQGATRHVYRVRVDNHGGRVAKGVTVKASINGEMRPIAKIGTNSNAQDNLQLSADIRGGGSEYFELFVGPFQYVYAGHERLYNRLWVCAGPHSEWSQDLSFDDFKIEVAVGDWKPKSMKIFASLSCEFNGSPQHIG